MTMRKHTFYGILTLVSLLGLGITQSARAYSVTLQQMGANVVANGSGAINLTGLTFFLPWHRFHSEDLCRWWGYNSRVHREVVGT